LLLLGLSWLHWLPLLLVNFKTFLDFNWLIRVSEVIIYVLIAHNGGLFGWWLWERLVTVLHIILHRVLVFWCWVIVLNILVIYNLHAALWPVEGEILGLFFRGKILGRWTHIFRLLIKSP
jgi:hypothetical protein